MRTYADSVVNKFVTETNGTAGAGALVTVYTAGSTVKAPLFDVLGVAITNPLSADDEGNYAFKVADGIYDLVINEGALSETRIDRLQIAEIVGFNSDSAHYSDLATALAANLTVSTIITTAGYFATDDGGAGQYVVVAGGTGPVDGGSFLDMLNGNQLQLILTGIMEISVRQFGAFGGPGNSTRIINAINFGKSNDLFVDLGGLDHEVTGLVFVGTRADHYKIKNGKLTSSDVIALEISGTSIFTGTLSSSAAMGDFIVSLSATPTAQANDIIQMQSNTPWYQDDRGESFTGELTAIKSVNGSAVTVIDAMNDSYSIPAEAVAVEIFSPPKVTLIDIDVESTNGTDSGRCITLNFCREFEVANPDFKNGQGQGFRAFKCYGGEITSGSIVGSNSITTGYGSQCSNSTHINYRGVSFSGCRRGIDFTGFTPSRFCNAYNCVNTGGGNQSTGEPYWNAEDVIAGNPVINNSGFGNHGPSEYCNIINCITANLNQPLLDRGRTSTLDGNIHYGGCRDDGGVIDSQHSGGGTYTNNKHYLSAFAPGTGIDGVSSDKSINYKIAPKCFVRIVSNTDVQMPRKISGNFSDGVQFGIVELFGNFLFTAAANGRNVDFQITDNKVQICREPGNETAVATTLIFNSVNTFDVEGNFNLTGNEIKRGANFTGDISVSDSVKLYTNNPLLSVRTNDVKSFVKFINDDEVVSIPINKQNALLLSVKLNLVSAASSSAQGVAGLLGFEDTRKIVQGFDNLHNHIATIPTGTTGAIGVVTTSWVDNRFYIENRVGGSRYMYLEIAEFSV
jgi:hypothetical protein